MSVISGAYIRGRLIFGILRYVKEIIHSSYKITNIVSIKIFNFGHHWYQNLVSTTKSFPQWLVFGGNYLICVSPVPEKVVFI